MPGGPGGGGAPLVPGGPGFPGTRDPSTFIGSCGDLAVEPD